MNKESLKDFLYNNVILEDNIVGDKKEGWLVPYYNNQYMLLPNDDIWHTHLYKSSHIKSLTFKTNGVKRK